MNANNPLIRRPVGQLVTALDEALSLLNEFVRHNDEAISVSHKDPASLLEQCLSLCAQHQAITPEPIRLVHHFACTGGTLFCKCIAAMPNVQLLSEVDPLSTVLEQPGKPRFASTDLLTVMRQSTRGANSELLVELFINNLAIIHSHSVTLGQRLVIQGSCTQSFLLWKRNSGTTQLAGNCVVKVPDKVGPHGTPSTRQLSFTRSKWVGELLPCHY
jgi:hypothetical protein